MKTNLTLIRNIIQIAFALFLLYLGVQFYFFVLHFETGGSTPLVQRPPGVEGFLPISALMSFKLFVTTGFIDPIHPAALFIFIAILVTSFFFKKGFCSWLCPIGTISEGCNRLGIMLFGRTFKIPKLLDYPLMSLKYLMLGFFVFVIFFQMNNFIIYAFLNGNYNKIADVKMLYFFTNLSLTAAIVLSILFLLSILFQNFWCRYLCPYGALLGVISVFSPTKVTRNESSCINCGACDRACGNRVNVSSCQDVSSVECTGCLSCIEACPKEDALKLKFIGIKAFSPKVYTVGLLIVFFGIILFAKATGNWETNITYEEYMWLIEHADYFNH
ncbi:polyferredoxin [Desulfitispora alkaliphila]|uniref:4Fe-4S binding protein n=1 Tax=Desulfitispora alkaliphila TaxID=622674 RepID=UPI003D1BC170